MSAKIAETPKGKHSLDFSPIMKQFDLVCDVCIAGGGLAGISAALSAAREGAKVVLVQNRSRLGGNASSEIRMHPLGLNGGRFGQREGGVIEELKLENAARNPLLSWEVWDLMLYDKCVSEPNITLLLDTSVCGVLKSGDKIVSALARSDQKMSEYRIKAKIFVDASGDSRMAMEAGAEIMTGREGFDFKQEKHGNYDEVGTRQGSTIMFTSKLCEKPVEFKAPSWAKKITEKDLKHRGINKDNLACGYWWIELGGVYDAIRDSDILRQELLAIILGVWDYIKNSGKYPDAANRALDWIGMLPGRRDTVRVVGDKILTQQDIEGEWKKFDDSVAIGGWPMDDHPKGGFLDTNRPPCSQDHSIPYYNIPLSCTYAKGLDNLMMAGRNISCTHVAFTSTRVMCTSAAVGQAVGTAAAISALNNTTPRALRKNPKMLKALQQELLRNDQTIFGLKNEDSRDLARLAKITASSATEESSAENVISGSTHDFAKENKNRWLAPVNTKPWIKLEWDAPKKVSSVRIVFDSWHVMVTQSSVESYVRTIYKGAEPRLVKDYTITATLADGSQKVLAEVKDNYQKLRIHNFDAVNAKSITLSISATNGAQTVRVKEIRVEA